MAESSKIMLFLMGAFYFLLSGYNAFAKNFMTFIQRKSSMDKHRMSYSSDGQDNRFGLAWAWSWSNDDALSKAWPSSLRFARSWQLNKADDLD